MPSAASLFHIARSQPTNALLAAAALILAVDPVRWLASTWRDPAYDSNGFLVFLAAAALLAWSVSSPVVGYAPSRRGLAFGLIALSATVRLAGQVLAINTVGALCLVLDVYALGVLLGLKMRARPISPAWLAVVFAFSLPLERIVQRSIGYLLQQVSAVGACGVLGTAYDSVACMGVRIVLAGKDVVVDLPCSGARGLILTLLAFAGAAAVCRPAPLQAAAGFLLALTSALAANVLRITVLAIGIAEPWRLGGIAVMEQPWHDLIGLASLALACAPLLAWAQRVWRPQCAADASSSSGPAAARSHGLPMVVGLAAFAGALAIVNLPRTPADVAQRYLAVSLPITLAGHAREPVALNPREQAFFAQYGGAAAKAQYGPHGLLLVRTTSPLRHLHTPDDCLRGIGFRVVYLGTEFAPVATAVYRATAPDGARYRVEVSFVSDRGEVTGNVATAVWRWLNGAARSWTAVQRISPEDLAEPERGQWTAAVVAALELGAPSFQSSSLATERGDRE
ncbi:MAG TPA: exosortase T [Hyphomicrobiaceae bacterium]|jgi:exosortase/archaeosortase family protein|nr:exosortase T [Hyphomicrobiaceae bacterium]